MTDTMKFPAVTDVQSQIHELPDRPPFMLTADLAEFYGTSARTVNQAVKRNIERFPEDFYFALTEVEEVILRSQIVTANTEIALSTKARYAAFGFTEAGALALSGILKTPRAAEMSVIINRGFVALQQLVNKELAKLHRQHEVCAAFARAFNPMWGKIANLQQSGISKDVVHKYFSHAEWKIGQIVEEMETYGVIDPNGWSRGISDWYSFHPNAQKIVPDGAPEPEDDHEPEGEA